MIKRLKNKDVEVAKSMHSVFQASYKVEGELLKAVNFPPLQRLVEDYMRCDSQFFGYIKSQELAGVVEVIHNSDYTHIRSLVVDPLFFRQGIGRSLMDFVLKTYDSDLFVVETGAENGPASSLYMKLGFVEVKQWETDHGIRKVKFEKRMGQKE